MHKIVKFRATFASQNPKDINIIYTNMRINYISYFILVIVIIT